MIRLQLAALLALACLGLLGLLGRLRFLALEFPGRRRRLVAAALLLIIFAACVFYPAVSAGPAHDVDPADIWFPALFAGHALLLLFLGVWWRLRRPEPLARFLLLDGVGLTDVERGLWLGSMGWLFTIISTGLVAAVLGGIGYSPEPADVPRLMLWLGALPLRYKLVIIAVAAVVEEAFFRAFLQTRVGWIPSSLLFAVSHASYGLPLLMVSVLIISLVIGRSLRQTGRLLPCIVAHGVFDAIQLLVVIPWAVRMIGYAS